MQRLLLVGLLLICSSLQVNAATPTLTFTSVQMSEGWALRATENGRVVLHTGDGGRTWHDRTPTAIRAFTFDQGQEHHENGEDDFQMACLNASTAWVFEKPSGNTILVERTQDGGRHWRASRFTDTVGFSLVVSFADAQHGSLLTISDMASGSTRKGLYRTADSGRTWAFVTKALPDHIDPTGIIFRNHLEGWLTAGYHGRDEMPLYRTNDGGHHWRLQELTMPALYQDGYGETYPPSFFGPKRRQGVLPIAFRAHDPEREGIALYQTQNAGRNWRLLRRLRPIGSLSYEANLHFINFQTGWASDGLGPTPKLWQTQDGGRHWRITYPLRRRSH